MSNYYYLSKEIFNKTLEVNALTVPIKQISFILKEFKEYIYIYIILWIRIKKLLVLYYPNQD